MISSSSLSVMVSKSANVSVCRETGGEGGKKKGWQSAFFILFLNTELHSGENVRALAINPLLSLSQAAVPGSSQT